MTARPAGTSTLGGGRAGSGSRGGFVMQEVVVPERREMSGALRPALFALAVVGSAGSAVGQPSGQASLAAPSGLVNISSGEVMVLRRGGSALAPLSSREAILAGDAVTTASSGRVEVLLGPGAFLRVAEDSEFAWVDGSIDNLRISLVRGSAIIDAMGSPDVPVIAEVGVPGVAVQIRREGVYRFERTAGGGLRLHVRQGRARIIGGDGVAEIGSREEAIVEGGTFVTKRAGRTADADVLDAWSRQRAETLAAASRSVSDQALSTSYSSSSRRRSLGASSSRGWVYAPSFGCHAWLPDIHAHHEHRSWSIFGGHHAGGHGWLHHRLHHRSSHHGSRHRGHH